MGVVAGKGHLCLEISSVVEGLRVDDHESHIPAKDFVFCKLIKRSAMLRCLPLPLALTSTLTHFSLESSLNSFMRMISAERLAILKLQVADKAFAVQFRS